MSKQRFYQVVLIWVHKPELFAQYAEAVAPVVGEYGGRLDRMLAPREVYGDGIELPHIVNIVSYESKEAFETFEKDPAFLRVEPKRAESIDFVSVDGFQTAGAARAGGEPERLYMVELAAFGGGSEAAYRDYESEADAFMAPFGFHLEWEIGTDASSDGLPFRPDLARVAYFDDSSGFEKAHAAPGHERIEGELYAKAVDQSLWIVGGVHESQLAAR
jgi:uncharacterized protein (DUF1330 family)